MTADTHDDAPHALPAGTRFGELEILGTLGVGGFGIVYLARDHALEREVAIKEYMPSQFASRDGRSQVSVRSASMRDTFDLGRRSFVNEAKLLARFDHPSLLKVYRFWEANGTAYMAMPRLVGANLREAAKAQSTPPPYAWVRRLFDAVLSGLEVLHAQQVWHRDVAPDNIFLPADGGPPILLDFGAARQAIGDGTQAFTAILKPSFAPIEQYAEATSLRQGPWTDLYALAAVMHDLLTGRPPPPATARAMTDEREPLASLDLPGYPAAFLAGLDWALRVRPHQRPQSAAQWREVLDGRAEVPARRSAPRAVPEPPPPPSPPTREPLDLEFADTVQVMPSQLEAPAPTPAPTPKPKPKPKPQPQPQANPAVAPVPVPARSRRPLLILGGGVAAVALLAVFALQLRRPPPSLQTRAPEPVASAPGDSASGAASVAELERLASSSLPSLAPSAAAPAPDLSAPRPTAASASARPASGAARRETVARPVITEKAGDFKPVPRSPVLAAPEPVASTPVVTESRPEPAAPAEPRTASEACGGRVLFARAWCIDRQCEKPIYRNDPECVRLRELRESRANH